MKKLFLVLALAFAGIFTANAQVWMGGSASAAVNKDVIGFTVAPEVGYCIPNTKWTVALGANYGFHDEKVVGGTHDTSHSLILSPYVRYSIVNIEKFGIFMDLTGDFNVLNTDYFSYAIALQPGIAWMATEHWTAAFRFAYAEYRHGLNPHDPGTPTENGFFANFTLGTPWIGLYYNF